MIAHLLSTVPHLPVDRAGFKIPDRPPGHGYCRPPRTMFTAVPDRAGELLSVRVP